MDAGNLLSYTGRKILCGGFYNSKTFGFPLILRGLQTFFGFFHTKTGAVPVNFPLSGKQLPFIILSVSYAVPSAAASFSSKVVSYLFRMMV